MKYLAFLIVVFVSNVAFANLGDDLRSAVSQKLGIPNTYIKFINGKKFAAFDDHKIIDLIVEGDFFTAQIVDKKGKISEVRGTHKKGMVIPVLNRSIKAKQIIMESDITHLTVPYSNNGSIIKNDDELLGKVLRVNYQKHKPIKAKDIRHTILVEKGQDVTLKFAKGGLLIETIAKALESGGANELIRVKNLDSNKSIKGRIIDSQTVLIGN